GRCHLRHRAAEFRKFLDVIDAAVPEDLAVHLVVDNYATHKTPVIRRWLAKRPRYHMHFTPTGASKAEPGRALVRPVEAEADSPRCSSQHASPGNGDRAVHRDR